MHVLVLQKNLYKADIYKASSHKMDTFFVHQIEISLKTTFCKAGTELKNNFHERRSTHIFLLKLLLVTIRSSFLHTARNFSDTFLCPVDSLILLHLIYLASFVASLLK